jgi:hypothetical protein
MSYIVIGSDETCQCDCSMKCIVDKRCGSSIRCTKEEIEKAGYRTLKVENAFYVSKNDILLVKEKEKPKPRRTFWSSWFH